MCVRAHSVVSDPIDCSPPGSSVHGIILARILDGLPFPSPEDLQIFLTQGLNLKLLHLQVDSLPLSYLGSPERCVLFFVFLMAALGLRCFMQAFSSWGVWGLLSVLVHRLLIAVSSLMWSTGSRRVQHAGSRAWAQQLRPMGLVAPGWWESSWIRDQTCVPCIGRQILTHCATKEVLKPIYWG